MIQSETDLRAIYGYPKGRSKQKVLAALEKHSLRFIELSPFMVISTVNSEGQLDASPRGGEPGFVRAIGDSQIAIPDSKGNNRVDSMSNIMQTGRIGTLFMIPGVDETLRINGSVSVSTDQHLLELFDPESNSPKSCLLVNVEEVFLHCAKAFMRSKLWSSEAQIERSDLATIGEMINDQLNRSDEVESQVDMVERYKKDL